MQPIKVYKGIGVELPVSLGFDVADDTITSVIRVDETPVSDIIVTWVVSFKTDGKDGELILTLDDSVTSTISHSTGYMDLKRTAGGDLVDIFAEPLEVIFIEETP